MPPVSAIKLKQIAYWKKHQCILKLCKELTQMCGSRILVCIFFQCLFVAAQLLQVLTAGCALQCVITTPKHDIGEDMNIYSGFEHVQELNSLKDGGYPDVCIKLSGNSVVFDSFSPADTVSSLNLNNNTISKANDTSRRFPTKFSVNVEGTVTAILSDATVDNYMVVNKQTQRLVLPHSRLNTDKKQHDQAKRPKFDRNDDSATVTTNLSSSSDDSRYNTNSPTQDLLPSLLSKKRPLEPSHMMAMQAPVHRFAAHQPTNVAPPPRPYASNFMQPPQVALQPAMFRAIPRPTVILEKPTYTRSDMKPLFAPSDEDEPPVKKQQPQQQPQPTISSMPFRMTKFPVVASTPSPPDFNKRPIASPSVFSPAGARFSSDDIIHIGGRSYRKSSSETTTCLVSVKDMLNMELPSLGGSRVSSQDEICVVNPRSRIPSKDEFLGLVKIGMRAASQDEIIAINTLAQMRS
jgi:hypothetical protein